MLPRSPPPHRPLYRVYHLTHDGKIFSADIIDAADDLDAIRRLKDLAQKHAVELWDRARFVAKAEPPIGALVPTPVLTTSQSIDHPAVPVEEAGEKTPDLSSKMPH